MMDVRSAVKELTEAPPPLLTEAPPPLSLLIAAQAAVFQTNAWYFYMLHALIVSRENEYLVLSH